jgi:hypothetical protein
VWPYDLIGDTSLLFALAKRTYAHRPFNAVADWSFDPIQAARLGLGNEVGETLVKVTEKSQHTINGLANWDKEYGEFYVEQVGVVAGALQEALAQDYDGLIRIAAAIPAGWDFEGSVNVRGKTRVDVQVKNGVATTAVIESGVTQELRVRNPWPGEAVNIVSSAGTTVVKANSDAVLSFRGRPAMSYSLERVDARLSSPRFSPISGVPAQTAKTLGSVHIGLFPNGQ